MSPITLHSSISSVQAKSILTGAIKISTTIAYLTSALVAQTHAQQIGAYSTEVHPVLQTQTCTKTGGCVTQDTKIVLDSNRRWLHQVGNYSSCRSDAGVWNTTVCPDGVSCAQNCAYENIDYNASGIRTTGGTLNFDLNKRLYLLEDDNNYKLYKLLNQEFTFDIDLSQILATSMPTGDRSATNPAGATCGTGYCDAQCGEGAPFIHGKANLNSSIGTCCAEFDILEANSINTSFTSHPCTQTGLYECTSPLECGDGDNRYKGICDKDGCGVNPWAMNNHTFYGPGSSFTLDSSKPYTVVTQFITDDNTAIGNLVEIKRYFVQNGKTIAHPDPNWPGLRQPGSSITDGFCDQVKAVFNSVNDHKAKGGLVAMGKVLQRGLVLSFTSWTGDLPWLDGSYPGSDPTKPGGSQGSCAPNSPIPTYAPITVSNIRVGDIGSTTATSPPNPPVTLAPTTKAPPTPAPTTSPATTVPTPPPTTSRPTSAPTTTHATSAPTTTRATPAPTSAPTTTKPSSGAVGAWGQCGGNNYNGPTACVSGYTCHLYSEWYSQCIPQ
ncbi:hypothetical protein AC1031_017769 [Aphanomyces cochlioides]|nr:hypothetical protein AC1031_017769 [Aphanomyces cochlioides]